MDIVMFGAPHYDTRFVGKYSFKDINIKVYITYTKCLSFVESTLIAKYYSVIQSS